ncbi:MAG: hypothetical protein HDQ88_02530 [Clostridia bacterium]|nr:hypothetical protein [Clostridia bacterium]
MYSPEEKQVHGLRDEDAFYVGWTTSKKMVKAFFDQRDPRKYNVEEYELEEEDVKLYDFEKVWELDILMLKSNHTDELVPLVTSSIEMNNSLRSIDEMFKTQSMICNVDDNVLIAWSIFAQLKNEYQEALHIIGYRQEEEEILYDSVDDPYDSDRYEAVDSCVIPPKSVPFEASVSSLESFIKVMEFDM